MLDSITAVHADQYQAVRGLTSPVVPRCMQLLHATGGSCEASSKR